MWNSAPIINEYKSFMCGTTAFPFISDLPRKADNAAQNVAMALHTVPSTAPEYGKAAIHSTK